MVSSEEKIGSITVLTGDAQPPSSPNQPGDLNLHQPSVGDTTTMKILVVGSTLPTSEVLATQIITCFKGDPRFWCLNEIQIYLTEDVEKLEASPHLSFGFVVFVIDSEDEDDLEYMKKQMKHFHASFFHDKTFFAVNHWCETAISEVSHMLELSDMPEASTSQIVFMDVEVAEHVNTTATMILECALIDSVDVNMESSE